MAEGGHAKVKWHGAAFIKKIERTIQTNLRKFGILCVNQTKQNLSRGQPPGPAGDYPHVLTGQLRGGIFSRIGSARGMPIVQIGYTKFYGTIHEQGDHPFLMRSVNQVIMRVGIAGGIKEYQALQPKKARKSKTRKALERVGKSLRKAGKKLAKRSKPLRKGIKRAVKRGRKAAGKFARQKSRQIKKAAKATHKLAKRWLSGRKKRRRKRK